MIQAVYCQEPWFAVASLDSAIHKGFLRPGQLHDVFAALPERLQYLRGLIDSRCESGLETIMRLLLLEAGIPFELQVPISGVGWVDFVVAGKLVIETDGEGFHGEKTKARDYDRDLQLAALGYVVLRLNYRQVMYEQDTVMRAVRALLGNLLPA